MQNLRGVIKFFTWLLVVVCFVQLSWTFMARSVESKADGYAASSVKVAEPQNLSAAEKIAFRDSVEQVTKMYRRNYLDSVSGIPVVDVWGIRDFTTYKFCREHALSLGLDLKGGMSLILEIAEDDVLRSLAYDSKDAQFNQAIINTKQKQKTAPGDFLTLFLKEYEALNPNGKLAGIFSPIEAYKGKIIPTSSNSEVINILRGDFDKAVKTTFQVLKTRIDQFGVASPNISLQENTGRIILELPGVDDPTRVRKLLQATAQLEFWDTYEVQEVFNYLDAANTTLRTSLNKKAEVAVDTTTTAAATTEPATDSTTTAGDALFTNADTTSNTKDTTAKAAEKANENSNPLFEVLYPNIVSDGQSQRIGEGPMVGQALGKDTARVNRLLARPEVRSTLPRDLVLLWGAHPAGKNSNVYQLFAIKKNPSSTEAPLTGSAITNATQSFDQNGIPEVDIAMNALGAAKWERMTEAAVNSQVNGRPTKRCIAIVLDNRVFSAPRVQQKIAGGKSQITGIDQLEEAIDLANILKSGKLEAKTQIIQEQVIGPSLGKESIKAGLLSLALGFAMVFLFMVLYYNRSGVIANIAMLLNLFILVCVLIGMGTSFTLPAMAGLLLTLAMAVDANVIINERVREEVKRGKGLRLAVDEGYGHSYNAIIDGNLTTMLVGIALMVFGLGPIQGFGVVLVAGLFTSMFTAVLVSRVLFDSAFNRNIAINFGNNITNNLFKNINFDFIGKKKISYTISTIIFVVSIASMLTLGFDLGVDFKGGRSYVIQFDKDINTQELSSGLEKSLGSTPQIKTYGSNNQLSVTTAYLVEEEGNAADSTVEAKVYEGVKPFFEKTPSLEEFRSKNVKSSIKIGAAVADDIRGSAFWAILFSLSGVFLYIFLRFKRWEYAAGAIVALIHDPVLVLGAFSLLRFVLPFSLEIDQNIVAAILTLIGYSVNDTVVVFDRIRETVGLHPTRSIEQNVNESINQTLSRTIMTVMTVLLVALILFVFGGAPIRGFSFALIIGLLIGTYSSIFVASPIMVDLINRKKK
ncbi:MAG TPA: protein translocase subunit SecDF [Chitinophagales bacterium]|nr:protein translocase subunit SecDF [Chitinophagales bacterium]